MFTSVSNATIGQQVVFRYTATSMHGFQADSYSVNGDVVTGPSIIHPTDVVEMVGYAPLQRGSSRFFSYYVNGVECWVGVATSYNGKKLMSPSLDGKWWFDFTTADMNVKKLDASGNYVNLMVDTSESVLQDTIAVLEPNTNTIKRIDTAGTIRSQITLPSIPRALCNIYHDDTKLYSLLVVSNDGLWAIDSANNVTLINPTVGLTAIASTSTGDFIWVMGDGVVLFGTNPAQLSQVPTLQEVIQLVSIGEYAYGFTTVGEVIRISKTGTITTILQYDYIGSIAVAGDKLFVAETATGTVHVYDPIDHSVNNLTGFDGELPWMLSSNDSTVFVGALNCAAYWKIDPSTLLPIRVDVPGMVTSAIEFGSIRLITDYMSSLQLVSSPSDLVGRTITRVTHPTVFGLDVSFNSIGSQYAVSTPFGQMLSNGVDTTSTDGTNLCWSGAVLAYNGKSTTIPIHVGSAIYDLRLEVVTQPSVKYVESLMEGDWTQPFTVELENNAQAYLSCSYGKLIVDGLPYEGQLVSSGSTVQLDVGVLTDPLYVTLGDAQYIIAGKPIIQLGNTLFDQTGGGDVTFSHTETTPRTYQIPSYWRGTVKLNGVVVTTSQFTTRMNDKLTFIGPASYAIEDRRNYVLLSSAGTYMFVCVSEIDTIPDEFVFDSLFEPFPSLLYPSDDRVISGIKPDATTVLYGSIGVSLVVNDVEYGAQATVRNGDTVRIISDVPNFFTNYQYVTVKKRSGEVVTVGTRRIYPITLNGSYKEDVFGIIGDPVGKFDVFATNEYSTQTLKNTSVIGGTAVATEHLIGVTIGKSSILNVTRPGFEQFVTIATFDARQHISDANCAFNTVHQRPVMPTAPRAQPIWYGNNQTSLFKGSGIDFVHAPTFLKYRNYVAVVQRGGVSRVSTAPVQISMGIGARAIPLPPTVWQDGNTLYREQWWSNVIAVDHSSDIIPAQRIQQGMSHVDLIPTKVFGFSPHTSDRLEMVSGRVEYKTSAPYEAVKDSIDSGRRMAPLEYTLVTLPCHYSNHIGTVAHGNIDVVSDIRNPTLVQDVNWNQPSIDGILYGAFATPELALSDAAAKRYESYAMIRRGDWYSYHVRQGMDVTCGVKEGIWAVSGLIGGG